MAAPACSCLAIPKEIFGWVKRRRKRRRLRLHGDMRYVMLAMDTLTDLARHIGAVRAAVEHYVNGDGVESIRDGPCVKVVEGGDARRRTNGIFELFEHHAGGSALHQNAHRLGDQAEGAPQNEHRYDDARQCVGALPPGVK